MLIKCYTVKLLISKAIRETKKYIDKTDATPTGKEIIEHFILDFNHVLIREEVFYKIRMNVLKSKLRPKGIRMSSVSNEMKEFEKHNNTTWPAHNNNNN